MRRKRVSSAGIRLFSQTETEGYIESVNSERPRTQKRPPDQCAFRRYWTGTFVCMPVLCALDGNVCVYARVVCSTGRERLCLCPCVYARVVCALAQALGRKQER